MKIYLDNELQREILMQALDELQVTWRLQEPAQMQRISVILELASEISGAELLAEDPSEIIDELNAQDHGQAADEDGPDSAAHRFDLSYAKLAEEAGKGSVVQGGPGLFDQDRQNNEGWDNPRWHGSDAEKDPHPPGE